MLHRSFLVLLALALSMYASTIKVENPYARATPPGLPNSAAFMTLHNTNNADLALLKAESKVAKFVELHTHDMKDGVMKMYQVPEIKLAANAQTKLKPGGFHIMLIGLYQPLKVDETIELILHFSNGEKQTLQVPVKTVMSGMKHGKMGGMKKGSCGQGKCGH